jgi:phage-related protein
MTSRNYDYILKVSSTTGFTAGNTLVGVTSLTQALIANVDIATSNIKVKLSNTIAEFHVGEQIKSNYTIKTTSANVHDISNTVSTYTEATLGTTTISAINTSKFIKEKNAFEQKPLVRLFTVYYPGEWYPTNSYGNPGGDGEGYPWPYGFPFRFAEIRGDYISDINYKVYMGGVEYIPYPINSGVLSTDSSGKINDLSITVSNFDNLVGSLVENPFLVGNNSTDAVAAIVNGQLVNNIDSRTVPGHIDYDASIVASRGGYNVAYDYDTTISTGGTWDRLKQDTRDLLGGVVEIKSTFANFLDVWPEYSTALTSLDGSLVSPTGNLIPMTTTLPYRVGDIITNNVNCVTKFEIVAINHPYLVCNSDVGANFIAGSDVFIINQDRDSENYMLDTFKIDGLTGLDEQVASFSLNSWLQYFKLQLPRRKFYKNTCPWIYKGLECQYPKDGVGLIPGSNTILANGDVYADGLTANGFFNIRNETVATQGEDVCAKNLLACSLRKNQVHFGGFPGTGGAVPR